MLIAVLSDLHLGQKDALDRFYREEGAEERFMRLLNYLENNVDRIVLLGDIFETLRPRRYSRADAELYAVLNAYPEIAKKVFDDPRYVFVHGNHDRVAGTELNAPEFHIVDEHGLRLAFFHGHQFDRMNREPGRISETGIWLGGWVERCGLPIVDLWDKRKPKPDSKRAGNKLRFARQAVALGKEMGADVVVTGHTHKAQRLELDSHLFLNSGTCVAGRREMLLLDTGSQIFRVVKEPEFC